MKCIQETFYRLNTSGLLFRLKITRMGNPFRFDQAHSECNKAVKIEDIF